MYGYVMNDPLNFLDLDGLRLQLGNRENSPFLRNYYDMLDANTKKSDRYFHCKANCEDAQAGPLGEIC